MPDLNLSVFEALPRFTLNSIRSQSDRRFLYGTMDPNWPTDRRLGTLYDVAAQSIPPANLDFGYGRDRSGSVLEVFPYNRNIPLACGQSYPCSRWSVDKIMLIADRSIVWNDRVFHPLDAWAYLEGDGLRVTLSPNAKPPVKSKGVRLDKGGWDHEHCAFCRTTISEKTFPRAFVGRDENGHEDWVCATCYDSIIVARNAE